MVTETGASPADVVKAFRIARDVTGAVGRWSDVEALDGLVDPALQSELMSGVDWLVETTSRWYLVQAAGQRARRGGRRVASVVRGGLRRDQPGRARRLARGARARGPPADRRGRARGRGVPARVPARARARAGHHRGRARDRPLAARGRARVLRARRGARYRLARGAARSRCRRPPGGSAGRSSRWRTICSRLRRRLCERVLEAAGGASIDDGDRAVLLRARHRRTSA